MEDCVICNGAFPPFQYYSETDTYLQACLQLADAVDQRRLPEPVNEQILLTPQHFCVIPERSGCYAFEDSATGEVLRVGLSTSLFHRVWAYLTPPFKQAALWELYEYLQEKWQAIRLRLWLTDSREEMEARLLARYRPRFNVVGGSYPRKGKKG